MKFVFSKTDRNLERLGWIYCLLMMFVLIYSLIRWIIYDDKLLFIIITSIILILTTLIFKFIYIDNELLSNIGKNIQFIDSFAIGHFLYGQIFYVIYSLIRLTIVNSTITIKEIALFSFLGGIFWEIFELFLYYMNGNFMSKIRKVWYQKFEKENNIKFFQSLKKFWSESPINIISDVVLIVWGSLYCLAIFSILFNILSIIVVMLLYFYIIKKKMIQNMIDGIVLVKY